MKFNQHIHLDYSDIVSMCDNLSSVISTWEPDMIVGLSRGGLIPAVHVSHKVGAPMRPIIWQTRDGGVKQLDDEIVQAIVDKKTVVFVDDINDSGHTFDDVKKVYCNGFKPTNVFFTSLVEKSGSSFVCDTSILNINDPRWIIFPWEEQC